MLLQVEEECDEQWDEEDDDREDFDQRIQTYILHCRKKRRKIITIAAAMLGMYHFDTYMNKAAHRIATESGFEWVMRTLGNSTSCYNMFRMSQDLFLRLHSLLVESYGLKSTKRMS